MAFTPNPQLSANTEVWFRTSQTASMLFASDQFSLAPKQNFLFHVAFGINAGALKNPELLQRHRYDIGMLVKAIDLPKFQITTETLNQYNRKKVVQIQQKYDPVSIKFNDDNIGVINQLWQNYYSYYYADPTSAANSAYARNATRSFDYIKGNYGLDNGSNAPFFNYIKVYQLARGEYVSYTLINPMITHWGHNQLAYNSPELSEFDMTIAYEAVYFDSGLVSSNTVEGFGVSHYDTTPSPLTKTDTTTVSSTTTNTTQSFTSTTSTTNNLNTVIQQINTYENTQLLNGSSTNNVIANTIQTVTQGVSGLQGIEFPKPSSTSNITTATPINIGS